MRQQPRFGSITPSKLAEHRLGIERLRSAKNYPLAKIEICPLIAQADLSLIELQPKVDLEMVCFDSRWQPGLISDADFNCYLDAATSNFEAQLRIIESTCEKAQNFAKFKSELKLKNKATSVFKEILMSILHFCCYSTKDALKICKTHFEFILGKLTTFENTNTFKLMAKF